MFGSEHVHGQGDAFFRAASEHELEGIVSKRLTSTYFQGRTRSWLKLKFTKSDDFIVVGFTKLKGSWRNFGALLLAYMDEGQFVYAGRVGTGFSDRSLENIGGKLERIRKQEPTFRRLPDLVRGEEVFWVKPQLVAEVNYCSWTRDGLLRHKSFKGLREDLDRTTSLTCPGTSTSCSEVVPPHSE